MRGGAADVVRSLVRSQCVYVTVGTTRTAMKEIVLMTTLPLYSTHGLGIASEQFVTVNGLTAHVHCALRELLSSKKSVKSDLPSILPVYVYNEQT